MWTINIQKLYRPPYLHKLQTTILETVESQSECLFYLLVAPQDVSKWHSKVPGETNHTANSKQIPKTSSIFLAVRLLYNVQLWDGFLNFKVCLIQQDSIMLN